MVFRDRNTHIITVATLVLLLLLDATYIAEQRWDLVRIDMAVAFIGLGAFLLWGKRLGQDNVSYGVFAFMLFLHCAYLYEMSFFGIRWDHYMHTVGGISIALIADRMVLREKFSVPRRIVILLLLTLGIGAIHEMVEFFGYMYFGRGEGFLLFGAGDEGEWRNAILDLCFDALGAIIVSIGVAWRQLRKN